MDDATKTQIKDKLIDYVVGVEDGVKQLVDFSSEQIPLLVQEIVTFSVIQAGIYSVISLALAGFSTAVVTYSVKSLRKELDNDGMWGMLVLSSIAMVVSFFTGISHLIFVLKAYFAPRLFMLEYIREFIK